MNQLAQIWASLSTVQRISLIAVPLLVGVAAWGLVRWKHERDFRPLYSGMAPEDAAAVTRKLQEAGIEYRLDETGSGIAVLSSRLADARLALAAAGLPKSGRPGYELLEKLSFGVSDTIEAATLHRALEGEIERTVATLSEIDQARIHLTFPKESVFLDPRQPAKATVVLRLKRGAHLSAANVSAIAYLVASAVDGLAPETVAVIDDAGRLLNRPQEPGDTDARAADANVIFRREIETDILTRINAALEHLVGAGKFHAGIHVDCDFTSAEQSEETYDSFKSAVLTSQTTEESTAGAMAAGTPGTASNLPQPPPRGTAGSSGLTRRTENFAYQPGHVMRRIHSPKGTVRRISTAVLVDQMVHWEGSGRKIKKTITPPAPEVLKAIHDIVAGITGFDESRGDQITVETLPFENTLSAEPPPSAEPPAAQPKTEFRQPVVLGSAVVLLLLVLVIGFFLLRRTQRPASVAQDTAPAALPVAEDTGKPLAPPETPDERLERNMVENQAEQAQLEAQALSHIKLPANTRKTEVLVKHIRESVQRDPGAAANVLRTWVAELDTRRPG